MKKMKKVISLILVLALSMSLLAGCKGKEDTKSDAEATKAPAETTEAEATEAPALPDMTTEEITLSYASWENTFLNEYLAQKFMEKYPNIKVELVPLALDGYNDSLLNLSSSGELPDAFWVLGECDFAIQNGLLGDMTEYWENDPEHENVLTTINDGKFGYYGTDKKWATPVKYMPDAVYANMTVFEDLNVDMPSTEWTWDQMIDSVKQMTVPEKGYYGYNDYRTIVTWYPIASSDTVWGEFGWDGTKFDMSSWAVGLNQQAELMNGKYHAPLFDTDEAEAAFGDRTMWAAYSGKVAYQFDAWWTYNNLFSTQEYLDLGLKYVPYMIPRAEGTSSKHMVGTMDFGGISSNTEHPREAYELLKFMTWGQEGWANRIEGYKTLTDDAGKAISEDCLPLTLDQGTWDAVAQFYPTGDDERAPYFEAFFANCKEPIPYGGTIIPGFGTFIAEAYAGVEDSVINGGVNAQDIQADLTEKLNAAHEEAMTNFQ
jgi:multiple sugar transport system substrate-binding protein